MLRRLRTLSHEHKSHNTFLPAFFAAAQRAFAARERRLLPAASLIGGWGKSILILFPQN
jgi:hypothetical protein